MHRMHRGKPHRLKYPRVSAKQFCKEASRRKSSKAPQKFKANKRRVQGETSVQRAPQKEEKKSYHSPNNQEDKV